MPMGGEASRFKKNGIYTPKPLIMANDKPFFIRALSGIIDEISLDNIEITFIIREDDDINYNLSNKLKQYAHNANISIIKQTTRGSVETCLYAEKFISENSSVLVLDCDLTFKCNQYVNEIKKSLNNESDYDGLLLSFTSDKDKYSYAVIDENNIVLKTAEKQVISNNAIIGAYYFNKSNDFLKYAHELVDSNDLSSKEFYTSLLYNKMSSNNQKILLCNADYYKSFGTPEEL